MGVWEQPTKVTSPPEDQSHFNRVKLSGREGKGWEKTVQGRLFFHPLCLRTIMQVTSFTKKASTTRRGQCNRKTAGAGGEVRGGSGRERKGRHRLKDLDRVTSEQQTNRLLSDTKRWKNLLRFSQKQRPRYFLVFYPRSERRVTPLEIPKINTKNFQGFFLDVSAPKFR